MSNLTILNTSIRKLNDLFNLKDLHLVAGNEKKHEPYLFVRLETTKDLVNEIQTQDPTAQPIKTLRGTQGGTYACKELVIAYAAWISPAFHLTVLRAFLNHVENSQNVQQNLPLATIEEPTYTHKLKQSELEDLAWLWFSAQRMEDFIRTIQPALDGLSSAYYPQAYTMCVEYGNHIKHTGKLIYRLTQDIEFKGKPFQALYQLLGKKHDGKF